MHCFLRLFHNYRELPWSTITGAVAQSFSDGVLEVTGFHSAAHFGGYLATAPPCPSMAISGSKRLAQARGEQGRYSPLPTVTPRYSPLAVPVRAVAVIKLVAHSYSPLHVPQHLPQTTATLPVIGCGD